MRDDHARALLALDDDAFRARLTHATAFAQRSWMRVAARAAFPLALVQAAPAMHPRSIALGNAAQTLHPVAGQGLNLGLRDAFELAQALDHGVTDAALTRFTAQRARDRTATITLTDQYVSLFSNHFTPLRIARGAGLALFNLLPPLRHAIARRMMFGVR
jgi:2-octaprenyl-6-methoxyphenol hydroxylase